MSIDFTDIEKNLPNGQNMGGIPQVVYYAKHSDVLSFPTIPSASGQTTLEKMGELIGDLQMKSNKTLHRLYVTDDEGKLDFESVGEKDGKSFVMKLRIYQPGLQCKLLGFINLAKNDSLVFIVPDNNGNFFLLGDTSRAACLDSIDGMTTGQKTEERSGVGLIFAYKTPNIYRYVGEIPITKNNVPEPEPEPLKAVACCPDGVDDYLSVEINALSKINLRPTSDVEKCVYTLDLIPGGMTFSIMDTNFELTFLHSGIGIIIRLYINGKAYVVYGTELKVNCEDKRVKMRLELSLASSLPALKLFVDETEETITLMDFPDEYVAPTKEVFYLFTEGSSYFNGKLFSFDIDKIKDGVLSNIIFWDFIGDTVEEKLRNKVGSTSWYKITPNNIADMSEFIKEIPFQ